jgi:hypothetical protein
MITQKGLEALAQGEALGKKFVFSSIGLGDSRYNPTGEETALKSLKEKVKIADQNKVSSNRIHLTSEFSDRVEPYDVGEIGIYASLEGQELLFAVFSKENETLSKRIREDTLLLGFDLVLENIPETSVEVVGSGERLNLSMAKEMATLSLGITKVQQYSLRLLSEIESVRSDNKSLKYRISELEDDLRIRRGIPKNYLIKIPLWNESDRISNLRTPYSDLEFEKKTSNPLRMVICGLETFGIQVSVKGENPLDVYLQGSLNLTVNDVPEGKDSVNGFIYPKVISGVDILTYPKRLDFIFDEPNLNSPGKKIFNEMYIKTDIEIVGQMFSYSPQLMAVLYE